MSLNQLPYYCEIPDRFFIQVSGQDAEQFLQGLLTNDVTTVESGSCLYALFLTPQGRFWCDLFIHKLGTDTYVLEGTEPQREALFKKLSLYKLRSDVQISFVSGYRVGCIVGLDHTTQAVLENIPELCLAQDPRTPDLGYRYLVQDDPEGKFLEAFQEMAIRPASYETYEILRISLGVPEGLKDMIPDRTFPLEASMDLWHAISFDKGCYLGQELTARTHHRGEVRKKYMTIRLTQETPWGTPVVNQQGVEVGTLFSSQNTLGLARIKLEALSDPLYCGGDLVQVICEN